MSKLTQGVLVGRAAVGAAWVRFTPGAGVGEVDMVRFDANARTTATQDLAGVRVENAGTDPVYVTLRDPAAGAGLLPADAMQVLAGSSSPYIDLYGTGGAVEAWVYGDASNPEVQVTFVLVGTP